MFELSPDFRLLVEKRLKEEVILWFTTVTPKAVPNTNPVWFLWDGEYITVYSQPSSWRVRNIRHNPKVALHLQDADGHGDNAVVINGRAELTPGPHNVPEAYWRKYEKFLPGLDMTREDMMRGYSIRIRVKPEKVRGG